MATTPLAPPPGPRAATERRAGAGALLALGALVAVLGWAALLFLELRTNRSGPTRVSAFLTTGSTILLAAALAWGAAFLAARPTRAVATTARLALVLGTVAVPAAAVGVVYVVSSSPSSDLAVRVSLAINLAPLPAATAAALLGAGVLATPPAPPGWRGSLSGACLAVGGMILLAGIAGAVFLASEATPTSTLAALAVAGDDLDAKLSTLLTTLPGVFVAGSAFFAVAVLAARRDRPF